MRCFIPLALSLFFATSPLQSEEQQGGMPIDVGTAKQLLFDDALIASKVGFTATMNPAARMDGPVLVTDKPWEKVRFTDGPSVIEDEGVLKMWYTCMDEEKRWYVCYATSRDGLHWEKPNLGLISFRGSKENNIVFAGTKQLIYAAQGSVFMDPSDRGPRKFKMVYGSYPRSGKWPPGLPEVFTYDYSEARRKRTNSSISAAYSPDGLRWTPGEKLRIIDWYYDTRDVAFWDDRIQKYVLFVRWNHETHDRSIGRSESADFESFPKPRLVLTPDARDPEVTGLYNSAAVKYPYADRAYFLFPSALYHSRGDVGGGPDGAEVQIATSRDGARFQRPWRKAFLGVGLEGQFDARQIYMGKDLIRRGDELWMYYTGFKVDHHVLANLPPGSGGLGVARIRLDGFVSQDAPPAAGANEPSGVLTTVPLRFSGRRLELNVNAGAGGWLKVEILDGDGHGLPGHSATDADFVRGNSVRKTVTWKGKADLTPLQGKALHLRFLGRDVKLYAFQFPA